MPSSRGSVFTPLVTTTGTAVGETVNVTVHVRWSRTSGAARSRVAVGGTRTRPTSRPFTDATTVCGLVNSPGSLWSWTVIEPPLQSSRVYSTVGPDQVSCGYRPVTR